MKKSNQTIFQERLLEALHELGLSQSALARQLGTTQQTVQQWCSGKTQPRMDALDRLSNVVGRPVHWFFTPKADEATGAQPQDPIAIEERRAPTLREGASKLLSKDEEQLINIYRDLPGEERKNMLSVFTYRLKEINDFVAKLREDKYENKY